MARERHGPYSFGLVADAASKHLETLNKQSKRRPPGKDGKCVPRVVVESPK
jgi:hypothetical protein